MNIKESMETYDKSTNYRFNLTVNEKEKLEKSIEKYSKYLPKRKNSVSSYIKKICLNSYLYINDMNNNISTDATKILQKKYYEDINKDLVKSFKKNTKEQDFIKELVRTEVLRYFASPNDDSELTQMQLRLADEDVELMRVYFGSKAMPVGEYITTLVRFFINQEPRNRIKIINYEKYKIVEKAIKNKTTILYHNKKYKPIQILKEYYRFVVLKTEYLLAIDVEDEEIKVLDLYDYSDIFATVEEFTLNTKEEFLIKLFEDTKTIKLSFEVVNSESEFVNNVVNKKYPYTKSKKVIDNYVELEIYNNNHFIEIIDKAEKANDITNLKFEEKYYQYKKYINL